MESNNEEASASAEHDGLLSPAQQRKRERQEGRKLGGQQKVEEVALAIRLDLLNTISHATLPGRAQELGQEMIRKVMPLYNAMPQRKPLVASDFDLLAQALHQAARVENMKKEDIKQRQDMDSLIAFAETLTTDVRHGNIIPSWRAHSHLLGIFKESGRLDAGVKFWEWLETQDQHVHLETYSVAIEILAIRGSPLSDLEALYQQALARSANPFTAYHLSPGACVPDRDAAIGIKGLPMGLLAAIVFARLLRGDSRGAYLGLDTALRLFPITSTLRLFQSFVRERPLPEAYTVFAIATRAGIELPSNVFRRMVADICTGTALTTAASVFTVARVTLALMNMKLANSRSMPSNCVSELVIALSKVFRLVDTSTLEPKQRKKILDAFMFTIRRTWEVFAHYGCVPRLSVLNAIIANVAGYGQSKEVLRIVQTDMRALNIQPDEVTRRSILILAGLWKDSNLVRSTWQDIVAARRATGHSLDAKDFSCLTKACRAIDEYDFAQKQYDEMRSGIPSSSHREIERTLNSLLKAGATDVRTYTSPADFNELYDGFEKINADLAVIEANTRGSPATQGISKQQVHITLFPPIRAIRASEADMRKIYDEMTTAADVTPAPSSLQSPKSDVEATSSDPLIAPSTGGTTLGNEAKSHDMPQASSRPVNLRRIGADHDLGQLRYDHWKAINHLLQLAEKHDSAYEQLVDAAIARKELPPRKPRGFSKAQLRELADFGLSESISTSEGNSKDEEVTFEEARNEIRRLRGIGTKPTTL